MIVNTYLKEVYVSKVTSIEPKGENLIFHCLSAPFRLRYFMGGLVGNGGASGPLNTA